MTPPGEIDGAAQVGAIEPVAAPAASDQLTYPDPEAQPDTASTEPDYINTPNLAGVESGGQLPKIDEEMPAASDPSPGVSASTLPSGTAEDGGVNMDEGLGLGPVGLAEEQAGEIAEGNASQPVVDGIGTETPVELSPGSAQSAPVDPQASFNDAASSDPITLPARPRRNPETEQQVAFIPKFSNPMSVPESYGGMSASDKNCRRELQKFGVKFRELEPIGKGASCGIAHPIEVGGLSGGIQLKPAATLNCPVTLAFARWVKYELVPSSRYRYFSGVKTIYQMSSYSCRRMNSSSSNPWSEHAHGNAIDVGKFVLNSGKEIDVRKKGLFAFREKGLLKAVRTDSCKYFNTVLGPGSDVHHKDHFHFDLRTRKSGYRHCDL